MTAEQLFHSLTYEAVQELVASRCQESLHLDFKLLKDASFASGDDKKNLAKALSGFANSAGGLILWGVDARKGEDGVDCALALVEIHKPSLAVSRLNSLTGEAVEPTIPGVLHRAITNTEERGFVATFVPESDSGPHMAKLGEDRYFKRSGDSFYRMEHFDIADQFGTRRRPKVKVVARLQGLGAQVQIDVGLSNEGRLGAKNVYLSLWSTAPFGRSRWGLDGNGNEGLKVNAVAADGYQWSYEGGSDWVLHPGVTRYIARFNLGLVPQNPPAVDCEISYGIACDEQPLEKGSLKIPLHRLLAGA